MEFMKHGRRNYSSLGFSDLETADVFEKMVEGRFLVQLTASDTMSLQDQRMKEEEAAFAESSTSNRGMPVTSSDKAKILKEMAKKKAEYNDQVPTGQKRKIIDEFDEPSKKQASDSTLHESHFYRINYERFHIHLRNEEIAKLAEVAINPTAGIIVQEMLRFGEKNMHTCKKAKTSDEMGVAGISTKLPADLSLPVFGDLGSNLNEYLETMAQRHYSILTGAGQKFAVNIEASTAQIQQRLVEAIVETKFPGSLRRIWRLLTMKGKLDEKQVSKMALMPPKDVRKGLSDLHAAGLVFIQRMFFLWYTSIPKSLEVLEQSTLRSLANLKQRRAYEVEQSAVILEKVERTDIETGQATLDAKSREALEVLNRKKGMLRVSEARLDHTMLLIRDI
ncbi:RNA polymerase III subunit RPC82-domain-containing protein [Blyttiomyces helicus]|uniref:DNA-directed RNA polymerase III subunit RPC3 n=1 Tax=Blyttiomyces helicus TaxID=388810 RepID=A0A4V1IQ45_9FUNG|nr:RNA polymerase III subunit RPC82-domain-containing protein [Blyttiomyces helicus]|eukprot:RKO85277.1 RNA polymerase III subunit RPC82-domain-containing protein [Blyttiomyces helicus]